MNTFQQITIIAVLGAICLFISNNTHPISALSNNTIIIINNYYDGQEQEQITPEQTISNYYDNTPDYQISGNDLFNGNYIPALDNGYLSDYNNNDDDDNNSYVIEYKTHTSSSSSSSSTSNDDNDNNNDDDNEICFEDGSCRDKSVDTSKLPSIEDLPEYNNNDNNEDD